MSLRREGFAFRFRLGMLLAAATGLGVVLGRAGN
jgi:hypothetical protein